MKKFLAFVLGIAGLACAQGVPWEDRLHRYVHRTYSWQRLTLLAAETGLDQLLDEPREWGREPHTYACRYSSAFGRRLVSNSIELALGAALNEDTRFRASGRDGLFPRLRFAALQAVRGSGSGGRLAYSRLGATVGGALITSRWRPRPMTSSRFMDDIASGYLSHLENSLLAEFETDLRKMGSRVRARLFRR